MKIVIVEDEASIRNGLSNILPKLNSEYKIAGLAIDGKSGLETIIRECPDLVILDIRLPGMDGLEMMKQLRCLDIHCKVIVLTAYSDFSYAHQAIQLGIEKYLLKPIQIAELKDTLEQIHEEYLEEKNKDNLQERLLSLEQIFRGCILAELDVDQELSRVIQEQYHLDADDTMAVFTVFLGENYERDRERAKEILDSYIGKAGDYAFIQILSSRFQMLLHILYQMADPKRICVRSERTILPAFDKFLGYSPVFSWSLSQGLKGLSCIFADLSELYKWNLCYSQGTLLVSGITDQRETIPLKYPLSVENHLKRAAIGKNHADFLRILNCFAADCQSGQYHPDEIRETCVRLCLAVLTQAQAVDKVKSEISTQRIMGKISRAVTWDEIRKVMELLYESVDMDTDLDDHVSILVKRARRMIEEYYNQGISLDRMARRLGVSEEYLSTQFKKETGMTFKETVRRYQVTRVKELLVQSDLKLSQIADMAGYSDSKYMSRVFKDETGMSPAEFRMKNR